MNNFPQPKYTSCTAFLLVMNPFSFSMSKKFFNSPSCLKDIFTGYDALSWQLFSLSILKMLLQCFWPEQFSTWNLLLIFVPLYEIWLFSLAAVQIFSLLLVLNHFIVVWLGIVFFAFFVLWAYWVSWVCELIVFIKYRKSGAIISSNNFSAPLQFK